MNFCFVINDNYVDKLAVLLTSIHLSNSGTHTGYVITSGLNSDNESFLRDYGASISFGIQIINVDDTCLDGVPILRKDFNKTPYYKLLIPQIIPQDVNKVLYLDADIVVKGSLEPLYGMDLTGIPFAAVPDPLINAREHEYLKRLGICLDKGDRYLNSGVILFNIEYLRKHYSLDGALGYIRENGKYFKYHDQEVLNGMYYAQYIQAAEKYNYLTVFRGVKDMFRYLFGIQRQEISDAVVLHYANTKPWNNNYIGKCEKEFWNVAEKSPVYDRLSPKRTNSPWGQIKVLFNVLRRKIKS